MIDNLQLGDLEIDILKMCNQDRSFLVSMISNLKSEYFESQKLRDIYIVYCEVFKRYNKAPTKGIVVAFLQRENKYNDTFESLIDQIFDDSTIIDPLEKEHIQEEVVKFAKRSRMQKAIFESVDLLAVDDFETITNKIKDALLFNLDVKLGFDLYDVDERYKRLRDSKTGKMQTGYSNIDNILDGGWSKRELVAVMGPPGLGKSIFLPNFGYKALVQGHNVVHYSMEMSEERLGMRYDAIASQINMRKLIDMPDEIKKQYEKTKSWTTKHLKLKEFPTSMATALDIESHLEQLKLHQNFEPDIVIVDYGDIMRSTRKTNNLYEEQGWIFRELRALAQKKDVAIITATQTNRDSLAADGGTKDSIGMSNTADSMEKNRILDALFSIVQSRKEKDEGKLNLWMVKNRYGETNKTLEFLINYNNMTLREAIVSIASSNTLIASEDEK